MREWSDASLESEVIRIVREHARPITLGEIFGCLYDRRDRLSELMATHKETTLERRRVKRCLDRSSQHGLLKASWENGQFCYEARDCDQGSNHSTFHLSVISEGDRLNWASQMPRFEAHSSIHDKLLRIFCAVAFLVLVSVVVFLITASRSSGALFSM